MLSASRTCHVSVQYISNGCKMLLDLQLDYAQREAIHKIVFCTITCEIDSYKWSAKSSMCAI